MLTTQQAYAELGYPVLPCKPGAKTPLTAHGLLDATTDQAQIDAWTEAHPNANWAIRTDGLIVVDVDALADGGANSWLADDHDKLLDLAAAPMSLTPRGGKHYLFRQPPACKLRNTGGTLAPRVDTRADGGYIVVAPSVVDGKAYRWVSGSLDVRACDLPQPPFWLLQKLLSPDEAKSQSGQSVTAITKIPSGQRNIALFRLAGFMRRGGFGQEEIYAALCEANTKRCQPALYSSEVQVIAASACRYAPNEVEVSKLEYDLFQEIKPARLLEHKPGEFPEHLLNVPGFIGDVMSYTLETAQRRQPELALAGAICLLSVLTGRKVTDNYNARTNLFVLGVGPTGCGKDWPRDVNKTILTGCGLGLEQLYGPEGFKSDSGLINAMAARPCMLIQNDEIHYMLQSVSDPRSAPHLKNLARALTCLWQSSHTTYYSDGQADFEKNNKSINQPHAVLFGTTTPEQYYESLTKQQISNGFLPRMLVFETAIVPPKRRIATQPIPANILEVAKWWGEFNPGGGNLDPLNPKPRIVAWDEDANEYAAQLNDWCDQEQSGGSEIVNAFWTRGAQLAQRLALLYACSADHIAPVVDMEAIRWAAELVGYLIGKQAWNAKQWVTASSFEQKRQSVLRAILGRPGLTGQELLHATRSLTKREREEAVEALLAAGEIQRETQKTSGRPATTYYPS